MILLLAVNFLVFFEVMSKSWRVGVQRVADLVLVRKIHRNIILESTAQKKVFFCGPVLFIQSYINVQRYMNSYSSCTTKVVIVTLCESNQKYLITKDPYDANIILGAQLSSRCFFYENATLLWKNGYKWIIQSIAHR